MKKKTIKKQEADLGHSLLEAIKVGDTEAFKEILTAYLETAVKIKKTEIHLISDSAVSRHSQPAIKIAARNKSTDV